MYAPQQQPPLFYADRGRMESAARVIQAFFRAYLARRAFKKLRAATNTIQAHAKGWVARKQVARERLKQNMNNRYEAVMRRHHERMQVLEQEKREVQQLPVEMMDLWDARRHRAAARIQAVWRGRLQRRKVGLALPSQRAPLSAGDAFATQLRKFKAESAPYMAELDGNNATDFVQRVTADAAVDVATGPDAGRIGHRRRQELLDYVESQMELYKALGKGQKSDPQATEVRLQQLMLERAVRQATAAAARRERQQTLLQTQALYAQLSQMPRLLELPESAQPHDFPLPPAGSDREVAARQAHALALSEARVGSKWWAQLKALNRGAEKGRLDDDDAERWAGMDQAWRRQWEQVTRTEEARQGEPVGYIRRPSLFPPQAGSSGHDEPATGTSQTSAGAAAAGGRQAAAADTSAAVEAAVAAIDPLAIRALAAKLSPEAAALMMGSEQDGGPNGS